MKKPSAPPGLVSLGVSSDGGGAESLLGLLLACHARIRHFARLAFTVGARPDLPPAEVKAATAQCLRYFLEALPLHVRDEEESLLPRLEGRAPGLDAVLAQMRAQHFAHEGHLDGLAVALRAVHQHPGDANRHRQLSASASRAETDLLAHLRLEEAQLFPFIATLLEEDEQEAVIVELRGRRHPRA